MTREINFLSERHKQVLKQEAADQKIMWYAVAGLAVSLVLFLIATSLQFFYASQLTQTKNQESTLRSQIMSDQGTEQSYVIFVNKLSRLVQIDQDRQDKKAIIQFFNSYFGQNITIVGVQFDQTAKLLTLQLQSASVFTLNEVLGKLNDTQVTSRFKSVSPGTLTRTTDGKYQITITVSTETPKI